MNWSFAAETGGYATAALVLHGHQFALAAQSSSGKTL